MSRVLVVLVFLTVVHVLLHRRLVRTTGASPRARRVLGVALAVVTVLAVVGFGAGSVLDPAWARAPGFVGLTWLVVLLYLVLGLLVLAVASLLARLVRVPDPARRRALRLGTLAVAVGAVGATGYGVVEAARPRVVRVPVALRRLPPEMAGLRVAVVSDLHVGPTRGAGFTRRVVDLVNAESPDVVALVGDLVDGTVARIGEDLRPLQDLRAPLGVFGVTGNHEYYAGDASGWVDFWSELGITPLRNERVELRRDGAVIDLAGIYDATATPDQAPDLDAALAGRDPDRLVVLLAHQPLQVTGAAAAGVDLQLSGHTHGGQVWPVRYLVPLQQPVLTGLARFDDTLVYTTRGAGAWGPPVRVGAPPEVTLLTLVPGDVP